MRTAQSTSALAFLPRRNESDRRSKPLPLCPLDQSALAIPPEKTGRPRCQKEQRAEEWTRNSKRQKEQKTAWMFGVPGAPWDALAPPHWQPRISNSTCVQWVVGYLGFFPQSNRNQAGCKSRKLEYHLWRFSDSWKLESYRSPDEKSGKKERGKGNRIRIAQFSATPSRGYVVKKASESFLKSFKNSSTQSSKDVVSRRYDWTSVQADVPS